MAGLREFFAALRGKGKDLRAQARDLKEAARKAEGVGKALDEAASGGEGAKAALAERRGLPVLMLTGFSETMSPEAARAIGIRDLLLKPVLRRDLAAAIEAALAEKT